MTKFDEVTYDKKLKQLTTGAVIGILFSLYSIYAVVDVIAETFGTKYKPDRIIPSAILYTGLGTMPFI